MRRRRTRRLAGGRATGDDRAHILSREQVMSGTSAVARPYSHPHVDNRWLGRLREDILEPELPIVDAHHHLWERPAGRYLLDELRADLAAGHNVQATVFIQCGYAYRSNVPPDLRPVGETERVAAIAAEAASAGAPGVCAGIVGYCDFRLGDRVDAPERGVGCGDRVHHLRGAAAWAAPGSGVPQWVGAAG
jgi:L-fuconolactonase